MWLPVITGARELSRPARRAKMLPMRSTVIVQPAALHHAAKRSRAFLSRSVSVSRQTPPFSVAPILASSIRESQSRWLLMVMFEGVGIADFTVKERNWRAKIRASRGERGGDRLCHEDTKARRRILASSCLRAFV